MPDNRRDYDKEYEALMHALADSVLKESPEELANDLREEGIDPDEYAEKIRKVMLEAVKAHRQQALIKAKRSYEDSIEAYEQRRYHLPATPERRRALFDRTIKRDPGLLQLTIQHREFTELTDQDITSYLRQLQDLNEITEDDLKDE